MNYICKNLAFDNAKEFQKSSLTVGQFGKKNFFIFNNIKYFNTF